MHRLLPALPAALLAACAPAVSPVPSVPVLAITGATVIDGTGAPARPAQTILVRGDRIAAIGPAAEVRVPRDAQVLDAAGAYVIPGLWDMHVHALWDTAAAESFLPQFLAHGVTGIRDMGGTLEVLHRARARRASGGLPAPRIVASGPVLDGPAPVDPSISVVVSTPADVERAVDSLAAAGVDFIKVYTLLPPDLFAAAIGRARMHGLRVSGHVPGDVDVADAARAGMLTMEHMRAELGGYCTRTDPAACDAIIPVLREHGTWQTPTLLPRRMRAYLDDPALPDDPRLALLPRVARDYWMAERDGKLAERSADDWGRLRGEHDNERWLAVRLHREGVPLLAGSDAGTPFSYPGTGLHDELALLVDAGLAPMEALQAATRNAAQALGAADSLGTIEPGKKADLVVLRDDPLKNIRSTRSVVAVVLDGRVMDRAALDALLDRARAAASSP